MAERAGVDKAKRREDRRLEACKMVYDHLKHLTTLATATAVVELALYRERLVEADLLVSSIVFLSTCVLGSVLRMGLVYIAIQRGEDPDPPALTTGMYVIGLSLFVVYALGLSWWWMVVPSLVPMLYIAYTSHVRRWVLVLWVLTLILAIAYNLYTVGP